MKKCIRKLLYSSLVAFISIGINFNAEARVTKEVAEATLPYLMETAEIPGDEEDTEHIGDAKTTVKANESWYKKDKIQAILSMIYTDEGQQQMVNWALRGVFPPTLAEAGFITANTYQDQSYRNISLASLFPCNTGTFTSFANHESRLGKYLLSTDSAQRLIILKKIFHKNLDVESILPNLNYVSIHDIR